jgi:hypothetical protein
MILYYLGFAAYVVTCLIVASYGRSRRIGITGFFLIGLLFTPVVVALILLVSGEKGGASERGPAA